MFFELDTLLNADSKEHVFYFITQMSALTDEERTLLKQLTQFFNKRRRLKNIIVKYYHNDCFNYFCEPTSLAKAVGKKYSLFFVETPSKNLLTSNSNVYQLKSPLDAHVSLSEPEFTRYIKNHDIQDLYAFNRGFGYTPEDLEELRSDLFIDIDSKYEVFAKENIALWNSIVSKIDYSKSLDMLQYFCVWQSLIITLDLFGDDITKITGDLIYNALTILTDEILETNLIIAKECIDKERELTQKEQLLSLQKFAKLIFKNSSIDSLAKQKKIDYLKAIANQYDDILIYNFFKMKAHGDGYTISPMWYDFALEKLSELKAYYLGETQSIEL